MGLEEMMRELLRDAEMTSLQRRKQQIIETEQDFRKAVAALTREELEDCLVCSNMVIYISPMVPQVLPPELASRMKNALSKLRSKLEETIGDVQDRPVCSGDADTPEERPGVSAGDVDVGSNSDAGRPAEPGVSG